MNHKQAVRDRIVNTAYRTEGLEGPQPWAREAGILLTVDPYTHWCALWYSTILRREGLETPDWKIGGSVLTAALPRIPKGERAQPGDLGFVTRGGHHAMVVHDNGDWIISHDGNGPGSVVVVDRSRLRSEYAGFYSIRDLVAAWIPPKYQSER